MDKQTEALLYANVLQIMDKMAGDSQLGLKGISGFSKKYGEYVSRGDCMEAVQYLKQVARSLNTLPLFSIPTEPQPVNVHELSYMLGCRVDTPFNVLAKAALKRIKELEESLMFVKCVECIKDRDTPRNKYDREILPKVHVDVYDVLHAFGVGYPELDHAIKKLLAAGKRGDKSFLQDLKEARDSIDCAVRREEQKN